MSIEVWPVIHVADNKRAVECAWVAIRCKCPGVLLISMSGENNLLDEIGLDVFRSTAGAIKIGVNYLGLRSVDALLRSQKFGYDATWTDRQEFTRGELSADAKGMNAVHRPGHKFFVAVAFKGQEPDPFPGDSAKLAAHFGFIPTTSGERTGVAPAVEKIAGIRRRLGPADPLAIASGVTPENVDGFAPYVSHVLVSTGISRDFYDFDEDKLRRLMAIVSPTSPGDK